MHRIQKTRVDKDNANILLNNMKWPIETMFVCIKPVANTTDVAFPNNKALQTWHRCSVVTDTVRDVDGVASCKIDSVASAEVAAFLAVADVAGIASLQLTAYNAVPKTTAAGAALFALAGAAAAEASANSVSVHAAVQAAAVAGVYHTHPVNAGSCAQVDVRAHTPTIDRLSITAHGIDIYKEMPGTFFHSYTPYTYGGHNIATPEDKGAHMITFCLYPGSYQPSGHVNVSRAREFYLQYWSEGAVSSGSPADLICIASAINFLFNVLLYIVCIETQREKVLTKFSASVIWFLIQSELKNPIYQIMQNRQIAGKSCLNTNLLNSVRKVTNTSGCAKACSQNHRETCGYGKNLVNRDNPQPCS